MNRRRASAAVALAAVVVLAGCPCPECEQDARWRPSIVAFTASPSNVLPGAAVTLAWSVAGADSLALDPGGVAVSGSTTRVTPSEITAYRLTARNAAGATTASATVTVSTVSGLSVSCGSDPASATVRTGGTVQVTGEVQAGAGSPDLELDWSIDPGSLGSVLPGRGPATTYTAPMTPGTFTVWGTSVWDQTRKDSCTVTVTSQFELLPTQLSTARTRHTATLLPDGKVLIAGGASDSCGYANGLSSAELFAPATRTFTPTGSMAVGRCEHTATLLNDGTVLVVGGQWSRPWAEIYDPATGTFAEVADGSASGQLIVAEHTATLLDDGRLLLAGGYDLGIGEDVTVPWSTTYDPSAGTFAAAGSLAFRRQRHTATKLPGGMVFVAGGYASRSQLEYAGALPLAECFGRSGWEPAGGFMVVGRYDHTATLVPGRGVLLTGGDTEAGITSTVEWGSGCDYGFNLSHAMHDARTRHTATLLPGGTVLVTGGDDGDQSLSSAELFDPSADALQGAFTVSGGLNVPRSEHTATLLGDGTVLVVGGRNASGALSTAELYSP